MNYLSAHELATRAINEGWTLNGSATMAVPTRVMRYYPDGAGRAVGYLIPVYYEPLCETRWYEIPAHLHARIDPASVL